LRKRGVLNHPGFHGGTASLWSAGLLEMKLAKATNGEIGQVAYATLRRTRPRARARLLPQRIMNFEDEARRRQLSDESDSTQLAQDGLLIERFAQHADSIYAGELSPNDCLRLA